MNPQKRETPASLGGLIGVTGLTTKNVNKLYIFIDVMPSIILAIVLLTLLVIGGGRL